jgi:Co/Zn/Cd efflux system component
MAFRFQHGRRRRRPTESDELSRAVMMHSHSIDDYRHGHVFLGESHERNKRKTWGVIALCAAIMVAEIFGGYWFGSVALIADGLHMSTHAGALLIAALAYTTSRRYARDERLAFGTGKFGDLAAFTSAIVLAMIALLIGYESVERLIAPVPIAFNEDPDRGRRPVCQSAERLAAARRARPPSRPRPRPWARL